MKICSARLLNAAGALLVGLALFQANVPSAAAQDAPAAELSAAEELALRFGIRSSVLDISLSPSGTKIAWIAPGPRHTEELRMFDLNSGEGVKLITSNSEIGQDLRRCDWVTDERLACIITLMVNDLGVLVPYDRLYALGVDGSGLLPITQRDSSRALSINQDGGRVIAFDVAGEEGKVLITRNFVPERKVGTRVGNDREGLGVDLFDINDGSRRRAVRPDAQASFFLADENGAVRLKARSREDNRGDLTGRTVYMVRSADRGDWERLEGVTLDGSPIGNFSPAAIESRTNSLLAYHTINGFRAVIRIPLDGSGEAEVVASRDDVDVGGLVRIGRQRRVVGVNFATEKASNEYFDPELARLARGLSAALPNTPLISFAGASSDESKLLIIASSDTDAGTVYIYDKATRNLETLLAMREHLLDLPMGQMKPVTYPASDGAEIPGYLTLPPGSDGKNLPAIVLPHGGPAARDFWGFDWIVQFFTSRGYAVLQPNFRGSSGYGEAWFGRNGYQAWDVAIGDVNDAGRWLVSEGIARADQLAVVGWSYGGYAALQSQVVEPELYKAVAAIAPVTDLEYLREDAENYTYFRLRDRQLGNGPHIRAGSPRLHAASFQAPVALFHGTLDLNVYVRHSRDMVDALEDAGKSVTYMEFEDLQHDLGDSKARMEMLSAIDSFLDEALNR